MFESIQDILLKMFESTYIYKYVWSSDIFSMYLVGACTLEEW